MSNEKQPIQEGLFGAAKKFSDAFFDGLKVNATNRALAQAQNNPKIPGTLVDKMKEFLNINLEDINQVLNKYYDNENALVIWTTSIENIIK